MTHKLLVTTFLLSHFLTSPLALLASSEDGVASTEKQAAYWRQRMERSLLSKEDALEAARFLGQHPSQAVPAVDAYYHYFVHAPIRLNGPDPTLETRAIYADALRVFTTLSRNEKFIYRDIYSTLMRWHLNDSQTTPYTLLTLVEEFRCVGIEDGKLRASQLYLAHPDKSAADKAHLFKAALAHKVAGETQKASILYSLGLRQASQYLTVSDVRRAALHFTTPATYEQGLAAYKKMFETFSPDNFISADFMNAAHCALGSQDNKSALDYLTSYFDYEMGAPLPLAYRLRATCATRLGDLETAKEYWLLAMQGGLKMLFTNYADVAQTFTDLGDHDLAATYWRKALSADDAAPEYRSYVAACEAFLQVSDYENALTAANGMLASPKGEALTTEKTDDLFLAAMVYSNNNLQEKSLPLWEKIIAHHPDNDSAHLWAGNDLYALGEFSRASDAFCKVSYQKIALHSEKPNFIQMIAYCHLMAGRQTQAYDIVTHFKGHNVKLKIPRSSKGAKNSKKKEQKAPHSPRNVSAMQAAIGTATLAQIQDTLSRLTSDTHETLVEIERKIIERKEQAAAFLVELHGGASKEVGSEPNAPTVSSSSSVSSHSGHSPKSFMEIQRLAREVESLNQQYKKEKSTLDRLAAKENRKQMIAQATKEEPTVFFPSAPLPDAKTQAQKRSKMKTRGKAGSPKNGASTSSSTSTHAVNLSTVEWRLTPTAQKHLSDLRGVPGFHGKFEAFRQEIEMEPWGRRGNALTHASGRAKLLKGYDNVFSRRFSKGDRFFYRVERQEDGHVVVTILGLMGHDLS